MKKFILNLCVFGVLLFAGNIDPGFTCYFNTVKQKSVQDKFDSLSIDFNDSQTLEYGEDIWNAGALVENYAGGSLDISDFYVDLNTVGSNYVTYTLSTEDEYGQVITKSYTKTIEVNDTQGPEISFKNKTVVVARGGKFNAADNIKSVADPVDGNLTKSDNLENGTYTVSSNVDRNKVGNYTVTVTAKDLNGNVETSDYKVMVQQTAYTYSWNGTVLTKQRGTIMGPSGKETYYNLPMGGVVQIMRRMGNNDPYWVRSDGVKMLGDYVMVAANLKVHPRGSLVKTSLGMGIVCDTGGFAANNIYQLDIAVNW